MSRALKYGGARSGGPIGPHAHVWVIGSGGREHALAWKLARSNRVAKVAVVPGNDGMPVEWARVPARLSEGRAEFARLADEAKRQRVDLVVVGPDNALADGLVDVFTAAGVACFGPKAAAARIEASKAFAKDVMTAAGVPTARYHRAAGREDALEFIAKRADWTGGKGWVVKADGLALGKGVRVCADAAAARRAVEDLIGVSGSLVIEERLEGKELSWLAFCDGKRACLLDAARDYKRLSDGDAGPNTGGMGAYSPVPEATQELGERIRREVFVPVLSELALRGVPFRGLLYAGLMVNGPNYWVLEFNARFGDPEAQALLPRMNGDLYDWCRAAAAGDLSDHPERVPFSAEASVVVVAAARGYPDDPEKGAAIANPGEREGYFWAGVSKDAGGALAVSGGRVFGATGLGQSVAEARAQAYGRLERARFEGMQYRKDVGA